MVAILVYQNKEMAAILVYQTSPPGTELYFDMQIKSFVSVNQNGRWSRSIVTKKN